MASILRSPYTTPNVVVNASSMNIRITRITSNFTSIFITLERIVKIKTIAIVTATDDVSPDSGWGRQAEMSCGVDAG
jgi:hypothetical protein